MSGAVHPLSSDRAQAALVRSLRSYAGAARVIAASSTDWASATFIGARHRIALALDGADAAQRATRLQATLAEEDLTMAGRFVADISVVARMEDASPVLGIEALTIEDDPVSCADDRRAG